MRCPAPRVSPTLKLEQQVGYPQAVLVGIDEVGRGCWSGPVCAAAVVLPQNIQQEGWLQEIRDSKQLSPQKREQLSQRLRAWLEVFSLGEASVQEIDTLNILQASHLAMQRAFDAVKQKLKGLCIDHILVDGHLLPKNMEQDYPGRVSAMIKGDQRCLSIAMASILAKVWRDQQMVQYHEQYPQYRFDRHKGYPTREHALALERYGPCPLHRKSFRMPMKVSA